MEVDLIQPLIWLFYPSTRKKDTYESPEQKKYNREWRKNNPTLYILLILLVVFFFTVLIPLTILILIVSAILRYRNRSEYVPHYPRW